MVLEMEERGDDLRLSADTSEADTGSSSTIRRGERERARDGDELASAVNHWHHAGVPNPRREDQGNGID